MRFAAERQQYVLDQLAAHGRVEAAAIAVALDVSTESIRKDLSAWRSAISCAAFTVAPFRCTS